MAVFLTATEKSNVYSEPGVRWMENELIADCLPKTSIKSLPTSFYSNVYGFFRFVTRWAVFRNGISYRLSKDLEQLFSALFYLKQFSFPAPHANCRIIKRHFASNEGTPRIDAQVMRGLGFEFLLCKFLIKLLPHLQTTDEYIQQFSRCFGDGKRENFPEKNNPSKH